MVARCNSTLTSAAAFGFKLHRVRWIAPALSLDAETLTEGIFSPANSYSGDAPFRTSLGL